MFDHRLETRVQRHGRSCVKNSTLQLASRLGTVHAAGPDANRLILAAVAAAALAFACLLLIGKIVLDDAELESRHSRQGALRDRQANRRTQQAILRLLDEMSTLAQGNLTVRANVTEELTGAIADSMNYAVDELRRVVLHINAAASELADTCNEAQGIGGELFALRGSHSWRAS